MSAPSYLNIELAEKEAPVRLSFGATNLEAVHIFDADSIHAINAALASGRPLLVRGEPGVGKSQLARAAAKELNRAFLQYAVDIQTEAQDLLWHFDSIGRLAEAQVAGALTVRAAEPSQHVLQQHREAVKEDMAVAKFLRPGPLWWAFHWENAKRQAAKSKSPVPSIEEGADPLNGCVFLIDEIDKAEADVPNGLLEALGAGRFSPLGQFDPVIAQPPFPLVVITTNEERALPDAFLRRCMVLNLELPRNREWLISLLVKRGAEHFPEVGHDVRESAATQLWDDRLATIEKGLRPLPGQAEYMDLLRALHNLKPGNPVAQRELLDQIGKFALSKHRDNP